MTARRSFFTGLLLFVFFTDGLPQPAKVPLKKILGAIEQRFDISFTYADDNIAGISVVSPPDRYSLAELLKYLHESTGLIFRQLSERSVIILRAEGESREICGTIIYGDTGELAPGASVQAGNSATLSDEQGYFRLANVHADSMVHIRFVGYRSVKVPAKEFLSAPCRQIALQPHFTTLQTIFVSDFITEGIDKKMDGSLGITARALGMLPGLTEPDVLQTIQTLPGIQSVNETIADINVRGGTNDQNLILWDGIRIYHSGHFFGLISAFNPYLTDKVTIVRNGTSAALGDGVSSTIDIRSDDEVAEKFSGGAGINMINADALAKIPLTSKMSVQVSARRSVADVFKTPTYDQYFSRAFRGSEVLSSDSVAQGNRKFYFYDTSLKWLYNITDRDRLRFSFLNVYNDIEYQENAVVNNVKITKTSGLEQRNLGSGISYSRLWNERIRTSGQLYLSLYDLAAVNFDVANDQRLVQENSVLDMALKADTRINLAEGMEISAGYQFFETGVTNLEDINNPRFRRSIKKVVRSHAVFSEGDFTFGGTNIRLGVRGNYYPGFESVVVEPRLAFNQRFLGNYYFEILGEMKNQSTAQVIDLQSDFLGVEKRRWVLSNEQDIPLIRSRQLSAGIYYKRESFLISIEGYYKIVNGVITSSQGFQNQFTHVRLTGNYETFGLDFLASRKVGNFNTWLTYSNAENLLNFMSLTPSVFPGNLDIRHRVTLGFSFRKDQLEFSSGLNWHSGKPYTAPVKMNEVANNAVNYDLPNSSRLEDYLRVDLSAKYDFRIGNGVRGQAAASVWNVLDKNNVLHQYYTLDRNSALNTVRQYSLGFTPNVLFRLVF